MKPIASTESSLPQVSIGWREWVALPQLGVDHVKVKIDTGARTSALHAVAVEYFDEAGVAMVCFKVHPIQRDMSTVVSATAPLLEKRQIRNSGGQVQERPVIRTVLSLGKYQWDIELTLTNRDVMGFRMLLGREAVRRRFLVDPGGSYLMSKASRALLPSEEVDEPDLP
ncbi:MAG: ATP-dependent zinc protease [Leptolyngbyaceae cyanobacterium]